MTTIPNFRDVGGVLGLDGARVRHGHVLRSGAPAATDTVPDGSSWPPAVVVDLRSSVEVEDEHPLAATGARHVNLPLLQALRPGWHQDGTLVLLYGLVLDESADLLVRLVDEVADAGGPTLVHCAAGKDRTGISVALLLRLLGVGRDDVVADYLLTAQHTDEIDQRLRGERGLPRSLPAHFYGVPAEAIEGVLDRWDAHARGTEGWFLDAGGDPASLDRLRSTLLA